MAKTTMKYNPLKGNEIEGELDIFIAVIKLKMMGRK
jgi:hypothetical protein